MQRKFYSEVTKQLYDSEAACLAAEQQARLDAEYEKRKAYEAEKAKATDKLDEYREALEEANEAFTKALGDYCRKYGTYEYTVNRKKPKVAAEKKAESDVNFDSFVTKFLNF